MTTRSITSRHAAMFVLTSMIGVGLLTLPRSVVAKAGRYAWLAVIVGAVLPLLGLWLQVTLCRRHPEKNFAQLCKALLGSKLGTLVVLSFIGYAFTMVAINCRIFIDLIRITLFFRTPRLALILLFVSCIAYAAQFGARVIGRIDELLFFLLLPIPLFIVPSLLHPHFTNLMPFLPVDLPAIAKAVPSTTYAYLGYETLMFVYWLVDDKKPVLRASLWATLFVVIQYIFVVLVSIVVIGPQLITKFTYPTLALVRLVEFPVFERVDLFALIAYIALVFRPCVNYYFVTVDTSARLVGKEPHRLFVWVLMIPLSVLANMPRDFAAVEKAMNAVGTVGILLSLGVPCSLLVVSYLRGRV